MGEYHSDNIRCFTPDNTPTRLYIEGGYGISLDEILDRARDHFGRQVTIEDLELSAEHIHTRCLGFDAYDPTDWTDYLIIDLIEQPDT